MNNDLLKSISDIYHEQYEAMRKTSNSIIDYEAKIDCIDNEEEVFIVEEGRVYDIDGDELFIITESNKTSSHDNSKYDFKNHDVNVGTSNLAIANILCDIFNYSGRYHHRPGASIDKLLYSGSKGGSNLAKYQKTYDLLNMVKSSNQNFCKIYYACDNIGKHKNRKSYVFFAELQLPDGIFYLSWHLMRDGMNSGNTKKKTPKNNICDKINEYDPNGSTIIKFGQSKIQEYLNMEEKYYNDYYKKSMNGEFVINKMVNAFEMEK